MELQVTKKIQGTAVNGLVLSVNEVPDGSASCMIDDISWELKKLREIAHVLKLSNADNIFIRLTLKMTIELQILL